MSIFFLLQSAAILFGLIRVEKQPKLKLHFLGSWELIRKILCTLYSSVSQQIMQPEVFQNLMLGRYQKASTVRDVTQEAFKNSCFNYSR